MDRTCRRSSCGGVKESSCGNWGLNGTSSRFGSAGQRNVELSGVGRVEISSILQLPSPSYMLQQIEPTQIHNKLHASWSH